MRRISFYRMIVGLGTVLAVLFVISCSKKKEPEEESKQNVQQEAKTEIKEIEKLGKALANSPEVSVAELLKNPEAYKDKIVRLSGKIDDFCHHKKAWFGITGEDGKQMVRVFTVPRFLAPADCLGKQAVVEGKVEVYEINPKAARHYAKEHKFLRGVDPNKPLVRPIVRAFGAELH